MYLSRLQLNPQHRGVRQCLADVHDLHRTLMRAFPQVPPTGSGPREHFGVLHRVEVDRRRDEITVLVQSLAEPDWSQIDMRFFATWPTCKAIGKSMASIRDGQVLAFRLRANPTRRVYREPGDTDGRQVGKRVALTVTRDPLTGEVIRDADRARLEWLQRKGTDGGFALAEVVDHPGVPDVQVIPENRVFGSGRRKVFWPVLFEGHLVVTDADQFRRTLVKGIGPAKAYGFGLLSVAPPARDYSHARP